MPWYRPVQSGCLDWHCPAQALPTEHDEMASLPKDLTSTWADSAGMLCRRFAHFSSGKAFFLMKSFGMNNLSVMSALIHPAHRVKKTHNSLLTSLGKWPVLQSKEIKKRIHWIMRSYHLRICTHKPANWEASADRLGQLLSPVEQQRNKTKMWKLDDFGYGFHVMMALHGGFLLG